MPRPNNPPNYVNPAVAGTTDEFLNPKSMLTPGIAGGIVMLIAQALSNNFQSPLAITAIILSFLIGLLVFITTSIPIWQRVVFYILNSLIIFSVAAGTSAAVSAQGTRPQAAAQAVEDDLKKAKARLAQLEESETQLKATVAQLNSEKLAADFAKLQSRSEEAREAVNNSQDRIETLKAQDSSKWIKGLF